MYHIVAWNYADGFTYAENKANAEKIKQDLEALKGVIPEIVEIKVQINILPTSTKEIVLYTVFESTENLQAYQIHPEHKKAGAFIGKVTKDRVCLDYFA